MAEGKKIGVLMGGMSAEREVSLRSGKAIHEALLALGFDAVAIDVGRDLAHQLIQQGIEVAMLAGLHGKWGEDGCVQGLLEVMGIPYTGSSVTASALAMDKVQSKRIFRQQGLPTADWIVCGRSSREPSASDIPFGLPCVVKPVTEGSSIGVTIVNSPEELNPALKIAFQTDHRALIEPYIKGRELNIGVLNGEALGIVEVRPKQGFYDYVNKYTAGNTEYLCPAPLEPQQENQAQRIASAASDALGCEGGVRVEIIMDNASGMFLLELNTLPGMTATSLLPKIAKIAGIDFPQLVERILRSAKLHVGC